MKKKQLTAAQKRLKRKHGTPEDFAYAVHGCLEITHGEATTAIGKYRAQWAAAQKGAK